MYFLGIDVGSSSVKLSVLNGKTGHPVASTQYPAQELEIISSKASWAEQDPATWWDCIQKGCSQLFAQPGVDASAIEAIGITYQMHGLVLVDEQLEVLRPAIIWCDSRAVSLGDAAFEALGTDYCFEHLLNSPGNFTAAKLRWVQENEPEVYARIYRVMLPGDYIAMKLSGETTTTATGLSEGVFWDFKEKQAATRLLDHWGIDPGLLPTLVPSIGHQTSVSQVGAADLGVRAGIPISYRCGDQPNNAFSLNVLEPGEVAATAGTSGVIYGVTDKPLADRERRVNTFLHVTHTEENPRNGVLVCVNGTGRSFSWLRQLLSAQGQSVDYRALNDLAANVPVGSDGLVFLPFGNGAERIFQNRTIGAHLQDIDLNRHHLGHIVRATQEGIVFALNTGFDVLKELGGHCEVVRVARGNMFLSPVFTEAFANTTQVAVELYETDGAEGAARGAALGCGYYSSQAEAFKGLRTYGIVEPSSALTEQYQTAYAKWQKALPEAR